MSTPIHVFYDCYAKKFCGLDVFQSLLVQRVVVKNLFVYRVTFGNIKLHLLIGLPKSKTFWIVLQNRSCKEQGTIICEQANRRHDITGKSFMKIKRQSALRSTIGVHRIKQGLDLRLDHLRQLESQELIHSWVDPLIP